MASDRTTSPLRPQIRLLLLATATGVAGGAVAVLFRALAVQLPMFVWPGPTDLVDAVAAAPRWWRLAVPVAGALLAGAILQFGARWLGASRGWDILEAVVVRDGILHLRNAIVRGLSSLVTIATAGPLGREGPMVLLSATTGSVGARFLDLPVRQRRTLVGCGVAAGIACAYNAPIGAALFTMEIIVGNFALDVFAPLVFASVSSTLLAHAAFSDAPVFELSRFEAVSAAEIIAYVVLGTLAGLVAGLFLGALRRSARLFRASRLPRPLAMGLAALAVGLTIQVLPEVVGNGREAIIHLFSDSRAPSLALLLLVVRLAVTALSVGSGAVGGVFTPTLFVGALLGDAFGTVLHAAAPGWTAGAKSYALVGMGALLAGTTHAPITSVLLLFEMTLDYEIVLPLLLASAAASLTARRLDEDSIYTEALRRKRGTPAPSAEAAVMRRLTVSDVMRSEQSTVPAATPLPQLLDRFIKDRRNHLYVVDADGRFKGAVSLYEASRILRESADPERLTAGDVARANFQTTTPGEHLDRTLDRFWAEECERLPVLDSRPDGRVVGTISKRDILGVYSLEVLHRRSLLARFAPEGNPEAGPMYVELPEDHEVDAVTVPAEIAGLTFAESRFRDRYGVSVLVLRREDERGRVTRIIPEGATRLQAGDRLIVFGATQNLDVLRGRRSDRPGGGSGDQSRTPERA